ncbi:MAG: deoxynucleoside kinase [Flavobacteriales bacterium]|nr:deoxynucleoside kinase [Flavobacteriales bacterium]MDG1780499.1 deoxynucleoside kinase [Flavobacteriales bacterium]MDG2246925.1 deoxynucleoside kinase [Flavobacteriales bacterium]
MGLPYSYISIEGNIGAGKTSLATKLAEKHNAKLVLEEFAENPFLEHFYKNPDRYAFPVELSFLAERFSQLKDELSSRNLFQSVVVSDYFVSKSYIFAKANLEPDEFDLFMQLFKLVETNLPKPDLLVYLYLPIEQLQKNIQKRGRTYEQEIKDSYLKSIEKSYFTFMRQHKKQRVVIIDTSDMDFVNNEADFLRMEELLSAPYKPGMHRVKA